MPVVLVTAPADPNANSYATLAEANAYHETILDTIAADWDDADPDTKNRALVVATRILDSSFQWAGYPSTLTQALAWPRYGAFYRVGGLISDGVVPNEVKNATAELARRLIVDGMPDAPSDTEGMKRLKAGPVDMEFTESSGRLEIIPPMVEAMISHLILNSSLPSSVPVIRT